MTIAGGVSPNVPLPGKSPGTNVFGATSRPGRVPGVPAGRRERRRNKQGARRGDERATPSPVCLRPEEHRKRKKDRQSRRRQRSTRRRRRRRSPHRRSPHRRETAARALDPTGNARKSASVDANKRETALAATGRSSRVVDQPRGDASRVPRQAPSRGCRERAAHPGRGEATRVTQTGPAGRRENAYENKNNQTRRYAGAARDAFGVDQRASFHAFPRVVRADPVRRAHLLPSRRGRARGLGRADVLAEERDPSSAGRTRPGDPRAHGARRRRQPGRGACFGARARVAVRARHRRRTYAWYKQFGFAGKGASSSWGFNPKAPTCSATQRRRDARESPEKTLLAFRYVCIGSY